jgi:transketolase
VTAIPSGAVDGRVPALQQAARRIRSACVQMAFNAREGHLSSVLSCADILVALYGGWLRVSPEDAPSRDRFILSKGHAATGLYAVLVERGLLPAGILESYGRTDGPLPNHPCKHALPMLEISSGSLGHGLGVATGMAYGFRLDGHHDRRIAVLMSDGECNEGSVWESAMFGAAHGLDRVLAIIDNNNQQAVGRTDELTGFTSFADKFQSFGWAVRSVDGHDIGAILEALDAFPFEPGKPSAIVAKTAPGHGVSFMEHQPLWHYRSPSLDEVTRAWQELGCPAALVTNTRAD